MKSLRVRGLAALVLFAAVAMLGTYAARASSSGDAGWGYTDKATVSEAQGILVHLKQLASGSYKDGEVDGATLAALSKFQSLHGIKQSGRLDRETEAQLLQHKPGKDSDGDGVPDGLDKCPSTPKGAKVDAKGCPIDSDGDGVADGLDKCPGTAKGVKVGSDGCPMDSDKDGVFDGTDQCPDTPAGSKVDAKGCPTDADGDGVADGLDKCPGTPKGVKVNAEGCPIDSDGDGVTDDKDKCPDTPRGSSVDAQGCPPASAPAAAAAPVFQPGTKSLVLEGVTFDTNSVRLKSASDATLDKVADSLRANPDVRVEVGGHTDNTGSPSVNAKLSAGRAQSVVDYLVAKGIAPSRLKAKGYGSTQPVADNKSADGRAKNRRVELKKID
ncbi:MAG TPA: OmpA family protein [Candidatus Polarisedimenticolia bacterium]|nr:OmpA family protein [Candidatus Polarisedimenticolia bacterium]